MRCVSPVLFITFHASRSGNNTVSDSHYGPPLQFPTVEGGIAAFGWRLRHIHRRNLLRIYQRHVSSCPDRERPRLICRILAGTQVIFAIASDNVRCPAWISRSNTSGTQVSDPMIPGGASSIPCAFSNGACGA